jgi:23S rRNA pseudouridine1911/1915/1917 synthase
MEDEDEEDPTDAIAIAEPNLEDAPPGLDYGENIHLHADGSPRIIERRFVVPAELAGLRLDHYLKHQIPRLSRTRIQRVISGQLSAENGRSLKTHTTVQAGDVFVLRRPASPEPPCPRYFAVLFEDAEVLVIDKPAGLPVHASAKFYFNTLARLLWERFDNPELQMCHRLDRETSGALVVAKSRRAAAIIKTAFAGKRVSKSYLAIVHGCPHWPAEGSGDTHEIDVALAVSTADDDTLLPGVRMVARADGAPAITRVTVEAQRGDHTLVRCYPVTGRQHQIRAHLALAGFPIVGDKLYAHGDAAFMEYCDRGMNPRLMAMFKLPRHALHAASVTFPHPDGTRQLRVDSPLPPDLARFLETAGS